MPAPSTPSPPDTRFRDHAANERTLLAWVRTGIALMAFGFALARFGLFLREVALVGQVQAPHRAGTAWFGVVFVVLGLLSNAVATLRFARARAEIDGRRSFSPSPFAGYALGVGTAVLGLVMVVALALTVWG